MVLPGANYFRQPHSPLIQLHAYAHQQNKIMVHRKRSMVQGVAVGYSSSPNVTSTAVTYGFEEHLTLGFMEASQPRVLSHFEALSAAMQWNAANGAAFEATFVRGVQLLLVAYYSFSAHVSVTLTCVSGLNLISLALRTTKLGHPRAFKTNQRGIGYLWRKCHQKFQCRYVGSVAASVHHV